MEMQETIDEYFWPASLVRKGTRDAVLKESPRCWLHSRIAQAETGRC